MAVTKSELTFKWTETNFLTIHFHETKIIFFLKNTESDNVTCVNEKTRVSLVYTPNKDSS